ncbi:MAG: glycoside hydrolase family 3 [Prosthecochloris sp.]|nr:glycoside hydrolase family 3 [Prosthecochloris sp.]
MNPLIIILFMLLATAGTCRASEPGNTDPDLDRKIGRMLMVGFRGMDLDEAPHISKALESERIGGVILFDYDVPSRSAERNIESPEQLKLLTSRLRNAAPFPLFIAIDQEGGRVCRLKTARGFPPTVSAAWLGKLNDPDSTYQHASATARLLKDLGINLNFAPVVDLDLNPDNPVIGSLDRSFSNDPHIVAAHAAMTIRAMNEQGIMTALKHFPGHGSSSTDTHYEVTDVSDSWQQKELLPYRLLIDEGYRGMIMTAHVFNSRLDADLPATLSRNTISGTLRDSLRFMGVVISDDMQMQAIASHYGLETAILLAIRAGVDILLFANNSTYDPDIAAKAHAIIRSFVENGTIPPGRIDESVERIEAAFLQESSN